MRFPHASGDAPTRVCPQHGRLQRRFASGLLRGRSGLFHASLAAVALPLVLSVSGCTALIGVDDDAEDPAPLETRDLPTRDDPTREPEGEPSVSPEGEPTVSPEGEPGVSPEGQPAPVEPESEPDAITIDESAVLFDVTPDSGLYANLTDASTVTVTVFNLLGDPMEDIEVQLTSSSVAGPADSVVVTPAASVQTGPDGAARFDVTSSTPGAVSVSATIIGVAGAITTTTAEISFDLCVSDETYYDLAVEGPVLTRCVGCHNAYGRLNDSPDHLSPDFAPDFGVIQGKMLLKFPDDVGARDHNIAQLSALTFTLGSAGIVDATDERADIPYLLAKPMGLIPHGGGLVFPTDDPAIEILTEEVNRLTTPDTCLDDPAFDLFEGVGERPAAEVFDRAYFNLTGSIPSEAEREAVVDDATLDAALDSTLSTQAFYDRLRELYNDILLTEENNVGARAVAQLNGNHFQNNRKFFFRPGSQLNGNQVCDDVGDQECCINFPEIDPAFCQAGRNNAVESVSREGLALIEHVVKNDRPFTEILTADYTMVNPYSAAVYGLWPYDDPRYVGTADPMRTYVEAQIVDTDLNSLAEGNNPVDAIAHAGILSTVTMLGRYPTTSTNLNRHRARALYSKFLGLDVMEFLNLVIDQEEELPDNLFTEARTCAACHAALDGVAGLYGSYRQSTRYLPNAWFPNNDDMRPPSFKGEIYAGSDGTRLAWLGQKVAEDERFALSTAKQMHFLLMGREAMTRPTNPGDDDYEAKVAAYNAQMAYFQNLASRFSNEHAFNLKGLIKDIVKGPYFTAKTPPPNASEKQIAALHAAGVGQGVLLTPEQLDRKLMDTIGYRWHQNGNSNSNNQLLNPNRFRMLLGGIDSDVVTQRFRDPFPIMAGVTRRMSNEMACVMVPQEFTFRDASQRRFLKEVSLETVPEDENGNAIPENVTAIRTVLKRMHRQILDEELDDGDAELEATYTLFLQAWRAGTAAMEAGDVNDEVPQRCRATRNFFDRDTVFDAEGTDGPLGRSQVRHDPQFVARAFMATSAYLLGDFNYLFE